MSTMWNLVRRRGWSAVRVCTVSRFQLKTWIWNLEITLWFQVKSVKEWSPQIESTLYTSKDKLHTRVFFLWPDNQFLIFPQVQVIYIFPWIAITFSAGAGWWHRSFCDANQGTQGEDTSWTWAKVVRQKSWSFCNSQIRPVCLEGWQDSGGPNLPKK